MDLHGRLLRANSAIMVALVVVIALALPFVDGRLGLLPAGDRAGWCSRGYSETPTASLALSSGVFGALLGAEAMIVLAIATDGGALSPAMALLCWPVAGMAGRFPDRVSRLGTLYAAVLAGGTVLIADPGCVEAGTPWRSALLAGGHRGCSLGCICLSRVRRRAPR